MLDMLPSSSHHGKASPRSDPVASTPNGTKRIPASLMKMRRESLANIGKYKMPTIEASALPDNSLVGMSTKGTRLSIGIGSLPSAFQDLSSTVSALVTPKKLTRQSLQESLGQASSHLKKNIHIDLSARDEADSPVQRTSGGSCSGSLVRSFTTTATTQEMDTLLKSGLVTPRRSGRLMNSSHHKRVANLKLRSKTNDGAGDPNTPITPEPTRRVARRTKSADDNAFNALVTPRCTARKSVVAASAWSSTTAQQQASNRMDILATPSRRSSKALIFTKPACPELNVTQSSLTSDDDHSFACESTVPVHKAPPTTTWLCTCGEDNERGCNFCGMCGTRQRWECADCSFANKCKFVFCGMCGIPKKTANQ
jgi:hypothetical protein